MRKKIERKQKHQKFLTIRIRNYKFEQEQVLYNQQIKKKKKNRHNQVQKNIAKKFEK